MMPSIHVQNRNLTDSLNSQVDCGIFAPPELIGGDESISGSSRKDFWLSDFYPRQSRFTEGN
jgi:hypothetical protein